jgi:group I intron endonuclease
MKSGVYRIVNVVNGKLYVGSSTDVKYRLWRHQHELLCNKHENRYLQNAWNKYGELSFSFEILFYCKREWLLQREQEMIDYYQSANGKGYNLCSVAGNCLGIKRSQKTREKMKGNTNGKGNKGRVMSQEAKDKMSLAKVGKSSGMKGKHHTDHAKKLMTLAKEGKISPKKGKTYKKRTGEFHVFNLN